jgi:hypothetical protein
MWLWTSSAKPPRGSGRLSGGEVVRILSSSGTRLTNEFRYLLDMINIAFRIG